jgi:hypothetical protein
VHQLCFFDEIDKRHVVRGLPGPLGSNEGFAMRSNHCCAISRAGGEAVPGAEQPFCT